MWPLVPEYIFKLVPYQQEFENQLWMEGHGDHQGYVDICKSLHYPTQRQLNYLNNGEDKIAFDINSPIYYPSGKYPKLLA